MEEGRKDGGELEDGREEDDVHFFDSLQAQLRSCLYVNPYHSIANSRKTFSSLFAPRKFVLKVSSTPSLPPSFVELG